MKKSRGPLLRILAPLAVIALVGLGLAVHTGTGTPSSWGIYDIAAVCPLGGIEALISSKTIVPPLLIGIAIVIVLILIFGRAFCAWGCPIPLLRKVFGVSSKASTKRHRRKEASGQSESDTSVTKQSMEAKGMLDIPNNQRGGVHDSRNWVLGGTVLTTAVFGFPVFCLICPVGLTFATFIALWRLFQFNETTLSLVVFPAILLIEILVLRKWCHRFCPLGALMSLIARANKMLRPSVNKTTCLHEKGEACRHCAEICPEGIDLHDKKSSAPLSECTKCRVCAEQCPVHAISFPLLPKKNGQSGDAE